MIYYICMCSSNRIRTHNHLVCKQTLKHLAKLVHIYIYIYIYIYISEPNLEI